MAKAAQAISGMPPLASAIPRSEATGGSAGSGAAVSREDHQHPRLTSASNHTLDSAGFATVTFTRTFAVEPALSLVALGAGTDAVPDFRGEFTKTGALWTGGIVYGERARVLPTIAPISGIALLSGLVTALNGIFAGLSGYSVREPASGARVSVIALMPSA